MSQQITKFPPTPASPHSASPRSRSLRPGSFALAVAVALAVAGCTGGAGLDIPVGPVDHSCHGNPDRGVLGSGCDRGHR
jgi:hypothetical protein